MAYAIADYRVQIANLLKDSTYATWIVAELDNALILALQEYSNRYPNQAHKTATLTASARFYDLTAAPFTLSNVLSVEQVLYPYEGDEDKGPLIPFELKGITLIVLTTDLPDIGEDMYLDYSTLQTINGLSSATATTVPDSHAHILATGAAAYSAYAKAISVAREFNWPQLAARDLKDWGTTLLKAFRQTLGEVQPASSWASWGAPPNPEGL